MATSEVNVSGRILPDGSLRIDQPIPLPPGEVQVRIQATTSSTSEAVWTVMEQIWAVQQARGFVPRSREEIDAEIRALRNEAEQQARGAHAWPAWLVSRPRSTPSSAAARCRRWSAATSNSTVGSAGQVSQALSISSASSCPASQPA